LTTELRVLGREGRSGAEEVDVAGLAAGEVVVMAVEAAGVLAVGAVDNADPARPSMLVYGSVWDGGGGWSMRGDDSVWSPLRGCWGKDTSGKRDMEGELTSSSTRCSLPRLGRRDRRHTRESSLHRGPVQGKWREMELGLGVWEEWRWIEGGWRRRKGRVGEVSQDSRRMWPGVEKPRMSAFADREKYGVVVSTYYHIDESSPRRKYNNNAVTLWSSRGTGYICKDYFITSFERFFNMNFFSKDYGNLCGGKTQCTVHCAWQELADRGKHCERSEQRRER
jgi:hypothetical protein